MYAYDYMEGLVRPEDMTEMQRRLNQDELLIRHSFKPVPKNGGELWISYLPDGVPGLWTQRQALNCIQDLQREEAR